MAYTDDNDVEHYGVYNNDTGGYDVTDDDGDKHGYAEEEFSDEPFLRPTGKVWDNYFLFNSIGLLENAVISIDKKGKNVVLNAEKGKDYKMFRVREDTEPLFVSGEVRAKLKELAPPENGVFGITKKPKSNNLNCDFNMILMMNKKINNASKSRRDDTLLTVCFSLRKKNKITVQTI